MTLPEDDSSQCLETTEQRLNKVTIGGARKLADQVLLADYDPRWPEKFYKLAEIIKSVLGNTAIAIEHVGSTSIPGLCAKPILDIILEVSDSSEEATYVPQLESVGFELRIREPDWWQHRLLKFEKPQVNLHVFSSNCPEIDRMLRFRDHLRSHGKDRHLYEAKKRELALRNWDYLQEYADAKSEVVQDILSRIPS